MANKKNIRLLKDLGHPCRCSQIGLAHSRGKYVVWGADDGLFSPNMAIDKAFDIIPKHRKGVVSFKFFEGKHAKAQQLDSWWSLGYHEIFRNHKYAPNHYLMIMQGLLQRDYLAEIGGWDCQFEHVGLGNIDLSIRLQNDGAKVVLGDKVQDFVLLQGSKGDHGPVKAGHRHDKGLFSQIYSYPSGSIRTKIDFNNWKQAENVWHRRFGG